MAQRELVALCDSAALTGTSMLASYDVDNDDSSYSKLFAAQQAAMLYSINMIRYGSILGTGVNTTNSAVVGNQAALFSPAPATGRTNIFVQYVDSANGYTPVDIMTVSQRPQAKAVQVQCCYGYKPVFFSIFNIVNLGTYILNASSVGGLPQVDTVLVFDFSGSMDDYTYVTFVNRVWHNTSPTAGNMCYKICPASTAGDNLFADQIGWDYSTTIGRNGTGVNVLPPQNLCFLGSEYALGSSEYADSNHLFYFDARVRSNYGPGVPAADHFGSPPGNCWKKYTTKTAVPYGNVNYGLFQAGTYTPSSYSDCNSPVSTGGDTSPRINGFTDLVVNIDDPQIGQVSPAGVAPPTYPTGGWIQPIYPRPAHQTGRFNGLPSPVTFSNGTYQVPDASSPGSNITLCWEPDTRLQNQSFDFPNLPTLVEASRGNMDSSANLSNAFDKGGSTAPVGTDIIGACAGETFPTPKANYQLAYQRLAMLYSQPFATAVDGAYTGFYQKLNVLADCRYGFVGFSAANPPANNTPLPGYPANTSNQFLDQRSMHYVSPVRQTPINDNPYNNRVVYYGAVTTGSIPTTMAQGAKMPRYQLSAINTQTQGFLAICSHNSSEPGGTNIWSDQANGSGLQNGTPLTGTHVGEAVKCAADSFTSGGSQYDWTATSGSTARPAARRAVILFTDGEPTDQGGVVNPTGTVVTACAQLKAQGCSLYCIGLNVNANTVMANDQIIFMGETGGGLCNLVGNGSKFFPCTDSTQVKKAFSSVVRRLTQGQK